MKRLLLAGFLLALSLALSLAPALAEATTTPVAGGQTVTVQTAPAAPVAASGAPVAPVASSTTTITTSAPTVVIPWGDWLAAIINQIVLPLLSMIILGIVAWISAKLAPLLPPWLRGVVNAKNTAAIDQLLIPAVATGLKKAADAASGQTASVGLGSVAIDTAAQYAIDHGPDKLIAWAGGPAGIRDKVAARIAMLQTPAVPPTAPPTP